MIEHNLLLPNVQHRHAIRVICVHYCLYKCVRLYAFVFVYSYVHMFFSKLKKLIRYIRSKQGAFQEEERQKKLTRYETDHFLEPFGGLTPEYMEMSQYYTLNNPYHFGSLILDMNKAKHKSVFLCAKIIFHKH